MSAGMHLSCRAIENVHNDQWNEIASSVAPNLRFLNKDWYATWEHNYLPQMNAKSQIKYYSLFDDNSAMLGIFPYVEFSKYGFSILSAAGLYYPFRSILFSKNHTSDCAKAFVKTIHESSRNKIVRLGPVVEDDIVNSEISSLLLGLGWKCYQTDRGRTHIINLPSSVSEYNDSLNKKFASNVRNKKRKLEATGNVQYIRYNNCDSKVWENVLDQCSSIEKKSWLAKNKDAELRITKNLAFWNNYLQSDDASRRTYVIMIELDGQPIAFDFAIDSGDCRYGFFSHYDEDFREFGAGILTHYFMIEDAINAGKKTLDMGDSNSAFKSRWKAKPGSRIIDNVFFPPSLVGKAMHFGLQLRSSIKSKAKLN